MRLTDEQVAAIASGEEVMTVSGDVCGLDVDAVLQSLTVEVQECRGLKASPLRLVSTVANPDGTFTHTYAQPFHALLGDWKVLDAWVTVRDDDKLTGPSKT